MSVIEALFWACLSSVAYVYIGYPLVLAAWSRLAPKPIRRAAWEPSVSIVIAAHNERDTIATKIDNCLRLDYPPDKLEIIISLDGSSDGTAEVLSERAANAPSDRVRVVGTLRHHGKALALNRAVEVASGEVVVFCDARQRVAHDAIRALVAPLADPAVGAVTGELMLTSAGDDTAEGVGLYWRYEKALRAMESRIHSTVGATGALYAIRRELFVPLPRQTILDDVAVPMRVVLAGRRTVFEPGARAFDRSCPPELEFRRKVRTLVGNFQLVARMPELLVPGRNPVFLQFVSHKLGRLIVPYFLMLLLVSNLFLREGIYLVFLVGQSAWYLFAATGALFSRRSERPNARARPQTLLLKGGHQQP
jgi:cellulose synthase/poly-beta-1,6-N-acetylglucosamine synthase-like glycosyltransferase